MKKVLKYVGILLGLIVLIGLTGFVFINTSDIPSYEKADFEYQVQTTQESLARGKKLATMLCANCHKDSKTGKLTGTQMKDAPAEFGKIFSANITQDKEYGIGNYTDAELVYLLRTGIKKNGQYAPPYMAKLPTMADSDIDAIIGFLRSDDPMVAADPTPDRACEPSFLTKVLCRVLMKPFPMPTERIELPDPQNKVALGKYLAHNLDCFSCHSADFKTNDFLVPENSPGYFGGGNQPLNKEGKVVLTANLTPDIETGIGKWTEEQFIRAVKYGLKDGEDALQYPMVPYGQLSDEEAGAIFQYLKTIPPIINKVERTIYD